MIRRKKKSKKKLKMKNLWNNLDFTISQTLIVSFTMIVIFTIVMIIIFCKFQLVPDSLIVAFFTAFGAEGGYCAWLHKQKKDRYNVINKIKQINNDEDEEDEGELVIDDEGEY